MAPTATRRTRRALAPPPPPSRATRTNRTKTTISYAESTSSASDANSDESSEENESDIDVPLPSRPTRTRPATQPQQRTAVKRTRPISNSQRDSVKQPNTKKRKSNHSTPKPSDEADLISSSTIIPKWQSLPYQVLAQVFRYATYPLYDEYTFQPLPSGRWLLNVARLCRGFAEPAFTVLYTTPPLVPMVQAHRLCDLLKADPRPMTYKYRQKVESLHIDVGQTAAYSLSGSGLLDLYGLIKDLPRLTDLEFYHQLDMAPYRTLDQKIKWTYPEAIFDALEYVDPAADPNRGDKTSVCQLRSWRWSSRLGGNLWSLDQIPSIHLKPSFASLRKVAFVNYQVPFVKKDQEDPKHENMLAAALDNLKHLEHLVLDCSTLVNYKLLPMLPKMLRHLELINCWEIVAEDFAPFLLTHGSQLRCLTLNHNQSLSLSFLPVLGDACPKLQVLRVNLTYFDLHATYHDSEPQYKQLLLATEVPKWPSTLQIIELVQMRKWETEAAEMFFQSLLDSAGNLPDLRKLSIQAILNIGWRDRASFRDKWVGSLARVFKRLSKPPRYHPTVRAAILEGMVQGTTRNSTNPEHDIETKVETNSAEIPTTLPFRKSPRSTSRTINPKHDIETKVETNSAEVPTTSRSHRSPTSYAKRRPSRHIRKTTYAESDSESDIDTLSIGPPPASSTTSPNARPKGPSRELKLLQDTVGFHGSFAIRDENSGTDSSSDSKRTDAREEVIQGMCEIVEVRIDNLRPVENQVTEADFLDEEQSGDDDWDGDQDEDVVWGVGRARF